MVSVSPWQQPSRPHRHVVVVVGMALLVVSAVAVVGLLEVVDLLAVSAVVDLLAVSAGEGLLVVVDFVGVGVGARVGAGGGPASMAPIAGGVRVAAVGSAHTIDRRAVGRGKLAPAAPIIHERRLPAPAPVS
jgi:Na+-transporting methylmalonyl-CoA/oxaloacetate decarboxylase beta subunit